jgi:hypothetical protein
MATRWFGRFELRTGETGAWMIGPYRLWLRRLAHEWRAASLRGADPMADTLEVAVPADEVEVPSDAVVRRFGFRSSPAAAVLKPALPDRPVIVSPEDSFELPAGERITLYLSLPVWVQVFLGDDPDVMLDEPAHRPTDTWFGDSTTRGELCYAVRTAARTILGELPTPPHRAVAVVEIRNRAKRTLAVEKLRIPVHQQSLYGTPAGGLWTERVMVDSTGDGSMATVHLGSGPPDDAADAGRQAGPRAPMSAGLLTRTFGSLVG